MKKKLIIGAIIATVIGIIIFLVARTTEPVEMADAIFPASEENGWIGEKLVGDPDKAKLIIYEYADFGCPHCSDWNKTMNDLMEKYEGDIALVFRSYDIGFQNGASAARSATSAQIQGYFKEYKDLLFDHQTEWSYAEKAELEDIFIQYFIKASDGKGDIEKFKEDMNSDSVKKRLKYENRLGKAVGLKGTPYFRINGTSIPLTDLEKSIENFLRNK